MKKRSLLCALLLVTACGDDEPTKPSNGTQGDGGIELPSDPFDALRDAGLIRDANSLRPDAAIDFGESDDPRFKDAPEPPACDGLPSAELLFKHTMSVFGMGVVGDQLYFAGYEDGIFAMPKDGSAPPKVVSTEFARDLATVGDSIVVSQAFDGIRYTSAQLAAGEEPEDVSVQAEVDTFGDRIYSTPDLPACFSETNYVRVVDASGETGTVRFPCGVQAATGVGDKVFAVVSKDDPSDGIYVGTLDSDDESARIVTESDVGGNLGATATHLYFTKGANIEDDYLMRAPVAGGATEVVAGPFSVNKFVSDGKDMFVSNAKNGCLYRFDTATDALVAVAKLGLAEDIVFDDAYIYAGTFAGAINRVKR